MIYADCAATTPVSDMVLRAMMPFLTDSYGNPSSIYGAGRAASRAVEDARERIAAVLGCRPDELIFTSCGSESDNHALTGILPHTDRKKIVTDSIEHHAVLNTCSHLEKNGYSLTVVPPDGDGIVSIQGIGSATDSDTAIVSVMAVNNETGTIQPIREIADIAHKNGALFHTDAVQAVPHMRIDLSYIDLMSISGHKFHAPKGIGLLYAKKGTKLDSFIFGGPQERGLRAGTQNVAGIVGMAAALEETVKDMEQRESILLDERNYILSRLFNDIPDISLNGSAQKRIAGNINISIPGCETETMLLMLDNKGICASGGSACASGALGGSHVLQAMDKDESTVSSSLRLSFLEPVGRDKCDELCDAVIWAAQTIRRLRSEK